MDPNQQVQGSQSQQVSQPNQTQQEKNLLRFKKIKKWGKMLNIGLWVVLFFLAPPTALIFLSQNSIPGDTFYPVKRGMENIILAAASVSPATKAAFRTDLTETRFKEAQTLVLSKSNATGLSGFIDGVEAAQIEVLNLKNDTQKAKAQEKLISKINEYQNSLSILQLKTQQNIPFTPIQTSAPTSNQQLSPVPQNQKQQNFPSPSPSSSLTLISSPAPTVSAVSQTQISPTGKPTFAPSLTPTPLLLTPTPTQTPVFSPSPSSVSVLTPTPTPIPTLMPTLIPTEMTTIAPNIPPAQSERARILEQKKIAQTLRETQSALDKIKKDLEGSENRQIPENKNDKEKPVNEHFDKKIETPNRKK